MSLTVAVTNYNGVKFLPDLLAQLRAQRMDHMVVLDDASTDGSPEFLEQQKDIVLVKGEQNLGPTGNRNRILDVITRDIILFLDVDMKLLTPDIPAVLEQEFTDHPKMGALGPLIRNHAGEPLWHNWGYDFNPYRHGFMVALFKLYSKHHGNPEVMATIRELAQGAVSMFEPPRTRNVDWIVEQFIAIRTTLFRELRGFDPEFRRFHEGPDLGRRIRHAGWTVRFATTIEAMHLDLHSGSDENRATEEVRSMAYYYLKHYGITPQQLDLLFRGS